jgi:D-alanyl-lipoteichoic acid acyltransferase DltB (MBOAT superfamily)
LGGNRKGKLRKNLNLLVTFLVSGIWHGNGTGYIFWGLYHGVLNMLPTKKTSRIGTFIAVTFGWIFFKLEDMMEGFKYIKCMFLNLRLNLSSITEAVLPFTNDYSCMAFILTVCLFILIELIIEIRSQNSRPVKTAVYIFYAASIVLFGTFGGSGFIYMNY